MLPSHEHYPRALSLRQNHHEGEAPEAVPVEAGHLKVELPSFLLMQPPTTVVVVPTFLKSFSLGIENIGAPFDTSNEVVR
jgi:hypothetical protein